MALARALAQCRGSYQRNLVHGVESVSGSTLRGKAKHWGLRYQESRCNLLRRLRKAGLAVTERIGEHGRRVLVLRTEVA